MSESDADYFGAVADEIERTTGVRPNLDDLAGGDCWDDYARDVPPTPHPTDEQVAHDATEDVPF